MEQGKSSFVKQKWLINAITILVIVLAFGFVFQELQRNKVNIIGIILPPTLDVIIGFLFILVVVIVNPFIWYFLMNGCGAQISKKEASGIWWSTNIAKYVPGRVSIIASRVWVARKWGPKVVLESLGWELILTTSSALIASSLLIFSTEIPLNYKIVVSVLALLSLFPFVNPEFSQKLLRKPLQLLGKDEWKERTVMTRMHYFNALLLMTITWILWGFGHLFILKSMGYDAAIWELIESFFRIPCRIFRILHTCRIRSQRGNVHLSSFNDDLGRFGSRLGNNFESIQHHCRCGDVFRRESVNAVNHS